MTSVGKSTVGKLAVTQTRPEQPTAADPTKQVNPSAAQLSQDRIENQPIPAGHLATPHPPPPGRANGAGYVTGPLPAPSQFTINGVTILSYGADPKASKESALAVALLTQRPEIAEAAKQQKVTMVVVPANRRLTDLPEFAHLRGRQTFDGRRWDDVRGVGGTRLSDGRLVLGVPEENLAELPSDPYPGNYSVGLHELGHVVQDYLLEPDQRRAIEEAYHLRHQVGGPWTDTYASSNEREYFAQGVNAYFGRNDGQGQNGADFLKNHDPRLYRIMVELFPRTTVSGSGGPTNLLGVLRTNEDPT